MARNTVAVTHCVRMQARTTDASSPEVPQGDTVLCVPPSRLCDSRNIEESVMLSKEIVIKHE
jgi:hypothetical protein